ncbi:terpenoid synthase [Aspergillus piperis CBS 112811]|uniref:Terpenoid synthase n=1 Tax=Aspergillus piperis CBS 112811 TaxID=1448313 RepID=A0A8G1VL44_9EURO|nr:terpenoid synthase [Aspergillus piperis CBS 112811]RAH57216.1 terpenoid synthase [Aspergillus piperis CBS 112811]
MSPVDISFMHSELVDREEVARVCATTLPVRKSKYSYLAEKAVSEFQQRWQEEVAFTYCGGSSPQGPVTAFFPPECKQDRVEVFTKLIEYFFAHDDVLGASGCAEVDENESTDAVGWGIRKGTISSVRTSAMKSIQSEVLLRLVEIDRKRGNLILRAIKNISQVHETIGSRDLKTWDDLVQYRVQDFGAELNLMSIIYCCELDLTQSDIDALEKVWWPATAAAALVNDLYSFNKEVILELATDIDTTITTPNSIWYLMRTLNLTVSQAKTFLSDKIAQLEKDFIARKSEHLAQMNSMSSGTDDVRYFLEMVGLGLSGNWYWHALADRFHRWAEYLQFPPAKLFDYDEATATCATFLTSQSLGARTSRIRKSTEDTPTMTDEPYYKVLHQPIDYLRSVPSKNIRGTIIQALNLWLNAPESAAAQVEDLIGHLHESSLLLDDIQDSSELRRGRPTAYRVFGVPQTINAATHALTLAFEKFLTEVDELRNLHVGQAMDLYWTRSGYRPSIAEYLDMNRLKTGALFCLASNLLSNQGSFSAGAIKQTNLNDLMIALGHYFQARDDYINLASTKYQEQKGFAQDLDEGKLSLPLIHLLTQSPNAALIEIIQQERVRHNKLPADLKQLILDEMRDQKILQLTEETLNGLEAKVYRHLERLEVSTGIKNFTFRFLLDRLREM